MNVNVIADRFRLFANRECKGSSELYEVLSLKIADDGELLHIATHAMHGQPIPNLMLSAVHYLLLKGKKHKLMDYYGTVVDCPRAPITVFDDFKDFCMLHKEELVSILQSKRVQTNEVRRCSYLYPAFCYIYEKAKRPLALIEIGTSAGLQLFWDQFSYTYQSNEVYGNEQAELNICSEIRGDRLPLLLKNSPPVTVRIGVDLHVNDLNKQDDYLWIKSLIWPDHVERLALFEKAARCVKRYAYTLIEGDGVEMLTELVSQIPRDSVVCIFHTHVANQIPKENKITLEDCIRNIGKNRAVFHLYNNMWDANLHLDYYINGEEYLETIAETDGHGRWFKWK